MPDITPNLGIKKPLGNENVSRASFNENWDILDANAAPKNKAQMVKLTGDDGYAPVPVATDLNNLITSGFYYGNNLANAPEGSVYHRIVVMMSSSTSGIQEATTNGGNRYIRNITSGTWSRWVLQLNDNAPTWTTLTLQNGVLAYSTATAPKFTKIGSRISLQGIVKNATTFPITIGTLPDGFRPTTVSHIYIAPSGLDSGNVPTVARITINIDGTIVIEGKSGTTPNSSTFYPLDTSFVIG